MLIAQVPSYTFFNLLKTQNDPLDDSIDRLSMRYTPYMMFLLFLLSSGYMFVGTTLECMYPRESVPSWNRYYSNYCFVQPMHHIVDNASSTPQLRNDITFYPWIPYVFLLHMICFYLPKALYNSAINFFGADFKHFIRMGGKLQRPVNNRRARIRCTAFVIKNTLNNLYEQKPTNTFLTSSPTIIIYLIKKWLYVLSPLTQLLFIIIFFAEGSIFWGFKVVWNYGQTGFEQATALFPLVINCRVSIIVDNTLSERMIPCIVAFNVVFEKVYVAIYFWLIFLVGISLYSAISHTRFFVNPESRIAFIKKALKQCGIEAGDSTAGVFVRHDLRPEGFLAYFLMRKNFSSGTSDPILYDLYYLSRGKFGRKDDGNNSDAVERSKLGISPPPKKSLLTILKSWIIWNNESLDVPLSFDGGDEKSRFPWSDSDAKGRENKARAALIGRKYYIPLNPDVDDGKTPKPSANENTVKSDNTKNDNNN